MPKHLVEIESQAPIIQELERCVRWAYQQFAGDRVELPAVTVGIQTRGKKATLCGHFKPNEFHTKEGAPIHEITISSEHLFEDVYKVLGTVVHESVHLFNHDLGEKDHSKSGRHNEIFRDAALEWGLDVDTPYDSRGHGYTHVSAKLQKLLETKFQPKETVFRIFKEQQEVKPKTPSVPKVRPWECKCPITLQVANKVELEVTCNTCESIFTLKEKA